jgi:hypothetical protein
LATSKGSQANSGSSGDWYFDIKNQKAAKDSHSSTPVNPSDVTQKSSAVDSNTDKSANGMKEKIMDVAFNAQEKIMDKVFAAKEAVVNTVVNLPAKSTKTERTNIRQCARHCRRLGATHEG